MTATHPLPGVSRRHLHPVCEHRGPAGWCKRLSVGATLLRPELPEAINSYAARCDTHLPPDAARYCLNCGSRNETRHPFRCAYCQRAQGEAE